MTPTEDSWPLAILCRGMGGSMHGGPKGIAGCFKAEPEGATPTRPLGLDKEGLLLGSGGAGVNGIPWRYHRGESRYASAKMPAVSPVVASRDQRMRPSRRASQGNRRGVE
jgi:hypothetical protein